MMLLTLLEWNRRGYLVNRGARAWAFNDRGEALFAKHQVNLPVRPAPRRVVCRYY